jgi:hypothetical protein
MDVTNKTFIPIAGLLIAVGVMVTRVGGPRRWSGTRLTREKKNRNRVLQLWANYVDYQVFEKGFPIYSPSDLGVLYNLFINQNPELGRYINKNQAIMVLTNQDYFNELTKWVDWVWRPDSEVQSPESTYQAIWDKMDE